MKKVTLILVLIAAMLLLTTVVVLAAPPIRLDADGNETEWSAPNNSCTRIQDGVLETSGGDLIEIGFADNGYNYQGHLFNGPWDGDDLVMKWNDAWLSNEDCDGDGELDRHFGFDSYIGSGAWLTNHWNGYYLDADGNTCHWTDFIKIVAAPADAYADAGIWYNADGTEIGPVIWGDFAIIQQVENDPCAGINGLQFNSPDHSGLGNW